MFLILPQKINFVNGDSEFDTNGVQYVINDEFGLTRAIWFQENKAQLLSCKCWWTRTEPTLRKALARC
jgi:electron transfer flavoprotein beta subunit